MKTMSAVRPVAGDLIAWSVTDTPFGAMTVAVSAQGVAALTYGSEDALDDVFGGGRALVADPSATDDVRRELDAYFDGRLRDFTVPVDLRLVRGAFARRVLDRTSRIPFGEVSTYGTVAQDAGSPRGARAAGNALGSNPVPIVVPCHRVVHAGGGLGGYTGGLDRKRRLLEIEGRVV